MKKLIKIIPLLILLALSLHIKAEGLKVQVTGEGQPLILIPGLTCDLSVWDATIEKYQTNYECHAFTLPGFAGNPAIDFNEEYLNTVKGLILEYIDENKLENPVIVGHSLGGFMAMLIAKDQPKLFSQIVIVDSLPFLTAIQMPTATAESAKPFAENMKKMMLTQNSEMAGANQKAMLQSMITDPSNIETAAKWGADSDANTVAQAMYELYTTDLRSELDQIEVPMLVLGAWVAYKNYGVTREMTLSNFEGQYAKAKNCTIKLSDKGKHFIMWDDPEFFFASVDAFLN
ncbi:MAG: alpha/beta hydrolase [Bacteroidota bacterium]